MSATLVKSLIAFFPAVMLLFGATLLFRKDRRASPLMQLLGATLLTLVVLPAL